MEDRYVTLRWSTGIVTAVAVFFSRYRWALVGAVVISVVPTAHLVQKMLTTGYPALFWGPTGRVTTFPGYLVLEGALGYSIPLAATHLSYAGHVNRWLTMLAVNFLAWLLIFVLVTVALRSLRQRGEIV